MQVKIDWAKKKATVELDIIEVPTVSSTGETSSYAAIRNQAIGQKAPDGRELKLSLQLYVKNPKGTA